MGSESAEAWRGVLDDLTRRGLRRPAFLIVDGAAGLDKAIAAVWTDVPVQRCTVHYAELRIMPTSAAKPAWEGVIAVKDAA
jgi:transposase-like protein